MKTVFSGRTLVPGRATGPALVSRRAFTFAHGVDPATGEVKDVRSDIQGENVKDRALFYTFGKGSTTASSWFLEAIRLGNSPAAIVTRSVDLSAVIGSVLARKVYSKVVPVMTALPDAFYDELKSGSIVQIDADASEVTFL